MFKIRNLLTAGFFITSGMALHAQEKDTLNVLNYNVNNYGFPATVNCPGLNSTLKHGYLRDIVQYTNPDILGLVKMNASPTSFSTDTVINKVLDSVCNACYGHAGFTNNSGYSKENMLYYKKSKVGFISTTTIYSGDNNISDINLHRLYYKNPNLSLTHDTTFINVILAHLASGSGSASDRATEIEGAMNWLNAHITAPGNYIFMGDLNTQSSSEACFQSLINSSNVNTRFYDPPNQPGNWANNPTSFANYLTQSTRVNDPGDCSATGGISYRYDHILCSQSIMNGSDSVTYIHGSYRVVGQDGNHCDLAIIDAPTNNSVPVQILNDLYYMSEHLPVTIQLAITKSVATGITNPNQYSSLQIEYNHLVKDYLQIKLIDEKKRNASLPFEVFIYNELGQLLFKQAFIENETNFNASAFVPGVYFLSVRNNNAVFCNGKFIKVKE